MREIRRRIFFVSVILIALGIVMIYSASGIFAYERFRDSAYYLKRHIFYLFLGILIFSFILQWDYRRLRRYSKFLVLISLFLLVIVLIPGIGQTIGGARRWFKFGMFSFQPSELAKFSFLVYTADFFVRKKNMIKNNPFSLIPLIIISLFMVGLILVQPDMGTAFLLGLLFLISLLIFEGRLKYILSLLFLSLPLIGIIIFRAPYRRERILAFL
ncbi:MAG: FtsW/RodA/SpoVE family cell cycle protein, partial [Candidatus Omnitrophota bacterium]